MRKFVLAVDGNHFPEGAFEFVRRLNEQETVLLTGVFLPEAKVVSISTGTVMPDMVSGPFTGAYEAGHSEKAVAKFEHLCTHNDIEFRVHKDDNAYAIEELQRESRFADCILIGDEKFYENLGAGMPNHYLQDALHASESPVMLVPEHAEFPGCTVLMYDGSASSVFAIKQFAYLFPQLAAENETWLVFAYKKADEEIPEESNMEEWAARHFAKLNIEKLNVQTQHSFLYWLVEKEKPVLVCGAYGRSFLSQMLRQSFAGSIISMHRYPVFTAHV